MLLRRLSSSWIQSPSDKNQPTWLKTKGTIMFNSSFIAMQPLNTITQCCSIKNIGQHFGTEMTWRLHSMSSNVDDISSKFNEHSNINGGRSTFDSSECIPLTTSAGCIEQRIRYLWMICRRIIIDDPSKRGWERITYGIIPKPKSKLAMKQIYRERDETLTKMGKRIWYLFVWLEIALSTATRHCDVW
jgi:hypothetical protein